MKHYQRWWTSWTLSAEHRHCEHVSVLKLTFCSKHLRTTSQSTERGRTLDTPVALARAHVSLLMWIFSQFSPHWLWPMFGRLCPQQLLVCSRAPEMLCCRLTAALVLTQGIFLGKKMVFQADSMRNIQDGNCIVFIYCTDSLVSLPLVGESVPQEKLWFHSETPGLEHHCRLINPQHTNSRRFGWFKYWSCLSRLRFTKCTREFFLMINGSGFLQWDRRQKCLRTGFLFSLVLLSL